MDSNARFNGEVEWYLRRWSRFLRSTAGYRGSCAAGNDRYLILGSVVQVNQDAPYSHGKGRLFGRKRQERE